MDLPISSIYWKIKQKISNDKDLIIFKLAASGQNAYSAEL
jgi:hypothetical protein